MPVDGTQPVYPPQTLTPITSTWGQSVSDAVVQKFASTTDRANKWVNPPAGSLSTIIGSGYIEVYRAGGWRRLVDSKADWFRVQGGASGQNMASGAGTIATWAVEAYDTANAIVNGQFACPATHQGWWHMEWSVRWPGPSTGQRNVYLANSFFSRSGEMTVQAASAGDTVITGSAKILTSTAYPTAYIVMFHNHSGGMLCNQGASDYFQGTYLGPDS